MDHQQKVLWSEGLFLTPQHFQQWERYFEHLLHERIASLHSLASGVSSLRIDEDALIGGEFALTACRGFLPDGLALDIPERDDPPAARAIEGAFSPQASSLGVFLGVPRLHPGRVAVRREEGGAGGEAARIARYRSDLIEVSDTSTGADPRPIEVARAELRILFEGEPLEDYSTLQIAELERTSSGAFGLREEYVPPCLFLSASPYLMSFLRRALEILANKSDELAGQRRERAQGLVEFTMSEAASFWLLHSVNANLPVLAHYHHHPQVHPEQLYLAITRLAGELYTFSGQGHPRELPAYEHGRLGAVFQQLEQILRDLLGTVVPTRCVPIPLERTSESLYSGTIRDERVLEAAHLYLAILAEVPEEKVIAEFPLKAKVSSRGRVERLIVQALRGLAVRHLPTPPGEIPVQPGRSYFALDQSGEHWNEICESRTISIYVPPEFKGLKIELMAVRE